MTEKLTKEEVEYSFNKVKESDRMLSIESKEVDREDREFRVIGTFIILFLLLLAVANVVSILMGNYACVLGLIASFAVIYQVISDVENIEDK